jgi:hypothetical protein
LFDLEKDPDEMENLLVWNGYDICPGYEQTVHSMVKKLKKLRKKYNDNTGSPVKFWPKNRYD